ncbi:MAG: hypothetical protein ACLT4C_04795 [Butyricicoccus sp.]
MNVGTGSQFSVFTPHYLQADGLDVPCRAAAIFWPVLRGGGRAYACSSSFSAPPRPCSARKERYDAMTRLLDENPRPDDVPAVCTV